jgi:hypothetical protein
MDEQDHLKMHFEYKRKAANNFIWAGFGLIVCLMLIAYAAA